MTDTTPERDDNENWRTIAFTPLTDWVNVHWSRDQGHFAEECPGVLIQGNTNGQHRVVFAAQCAKGVIAEANHGRGYFRSETGAAFAKRMERQAEEEAEELRRGQEFRAEIEQILATGEAKAAWERSVSMRTYGRSKTRSTNPHRDRRGTT